MSSSESTDTMDPRFRGDSEKKGTTPAEAGVQRSHDISPTLHSVESLRNSLPESYQSLFDTLRREVIDFCDLHSVPTSSLNNDEALKKSTKHLSIPDLEHLSLVLKRLEYLIANKEPMREAEPTDPLEYAEKHHHLREQYTSQISLLEQVGILKEGQIEAIDGHSYPVPTLEQIAERLYERREELSVKRDQGFTKLLLVPFGMSLDTFQEILKRFLLDYERKHPDFDLNIDNPLWIWGGYQGADIRINPDGSPALVYDPTSFYKENHQGKSKAQILEEQAVDPDSFPGWTIHLFQSSHSQDSPFLGIAHIPEEGAMYGKRNVSRPDIEANQTPRDCLSILIGSKNDSDSPYYLETGLTFEDWIIAFVTHLQETGQPLDDVRNLRKTDCFCFLLGSFFPSSPCVPHVEWNRPDKRVFIYEGDPDDQNRYGGVRTSVKI